VFKSIEKDERFLSAVEVVAIDHKDTWSKRIAPPGAGGNHDWLWDQLAKLPQVVPITPDLRFADGLAESLVGRLTGESLGDKKQHKLMGPIARGGFGTVYDATDTRTGTRVAVKVLEDRDGLDPKEDLAQFKRFQQEYEKLKKAGAETKGFIQTFEWGTNIIGRREYPWFSMEFATGGDLTARFEERRTALAEVFPWNEPESREAVIGEFRAIVTAVANLHELGIVHRDIKPGNILVLDGGELRLSDFGLVKDIDRPRGGMSAGPGSSRGTVVGTRDYTATEQERGETVTRAADVYALGILLAELASGRRPTPAGDTVAGSPVERDAHVQKLPEPLRRLIVRCTNRDPDARPDDASHVLVEFERVAKKSG
jgi:eukaryotic-like serine/threonine-protein kinase